MSHVILIPLLPLLTALMVVAGPPAQRARRTAIALLPLAAACAASIAALVHVSYAGAYALRLYDPAAPTALYFPAGLLVDRLSAMMMVLISLVGTLIYRYSVVYMFQDPAYERFLALIGVTTSVLLLMAASVNLAMLFLCWQLLSYLLYLLAHNLGHAATRTGAIRTYRFLRFGDAAFLAGVALAYRLYGTVEFDPLFVRAAAAPVTLLSGLISGPTAVALLLFVGVMSKSAQFPMHVWLPSSLYAPTPVTALLHAGLINAGGFLLNRLAPLYALSPAALHVALGIGALTTMLGASTMLTQNDIKKTLGFSTIGQMGYMVMECGLGAFALAVFHLMAHGLFKATVFLNCGNVIHKARQEPALPPAQAPVEPEFSPISWTTGFFTTLLVPLAILLVAHDLLRIPVLQSQSTLIFLFFMWITSCQALLTLTRLRAIASWKVAATMVATMLAVVFTYLFAAERFTAFLYPDDTAVRAYLHAAALPGVLFDLCVLLVSLSTLLGWAYLYARSRGGRIKLPPAVDRLREWLYVALMFDLFFLDSLYAQLSGWLPEYSTARLALLPALGVQALLGVLPLVTFATIPPGGWLAPVLVLAWLALAWLALPLTAQS